MIVYDPYIKDLEMKQVVIRKIQSEIDRFEPNTLKKIIFDLIKNDDVDTLEIYLKHLELL
ncbi:MAG: hypothetical protein ACFFAS_09125 [Promethearchaeota archaeon]